MSPWHYSGLFEYFFNHEADPSTLRSSGQAPFTNYYNFLSSWHMNCTHDLIFITMRIYVSSAQLLAIE